MNRIEAAWFDIDKTLVEGDNRPSPKLLKALAKIPKWGVNTQRSISQAERVILPQEATLPSIVLSGAEIWQLGKEMVKAFPLPNIVRTGIAELTKDNHDQIALARFYPRGSRYVTLYVATDELEHKFRKLYQPTGSLGLLTRSIDTFVSRLSQTETCMVTLRTKEKTDIVFPSDLKRDLEIDSSSKTDFVITAKGVRKATSLLWLCDHLGLDPVNVLTAGDNRVVDSEVFQYTRGISVSEDLLPFAVTNVKTIEELADLLDQIFSNNS